MATSKPVSLIVGASRGIGRQIAVDLAKNDYRVVVAAKSTSQNVESFPPDPNSPESTINTVECEIREAGNEATAIPVDARDFESIKALVEQTIKTYGRIDVLVYNSGAIWWSAVETTPMKRFKLMQEVNVEGLYGTIQACLPYFAQNNWCARIIVVSPPIYSRFFRGKTAYSISKVGMSVLTKGLAMDFVRQGRKEMAITSIWPAAAISSGATRNVDESHDLRKPEIFSDAILAMLRTPAEEVNGCLEIDEDFLAHKMGVTDFSKYSLVPGATPRRIMPRNFPDLTVEEQDDEGKRMDSVTIRAKRGESKI